MGKVLVEDALLCLNEKTGSYETFTVYNKNESANGLQKVYNMVLSSGGTFIINDVMVLQK